MSILKASKVTSIGHAAKSGDIVDRIADTQHSLNHALNTLNNEVKKLRVKSYMNDIPLSMQEIKSLNDCIKSLLSTQRQQLEAMKSEELTKKLSEMSDEQLLEYAKTVIDTTKTINADAISKTDVQS